MHCHGLAVAARIYYLRDAIVFGSISLSIRYPLDRGKEEEEEEEKLFFLALFPFKISNEEYIRGYRKYGFLISQLA